MAATEVAQVGLRKWQVHKWGTFHFGTITKRTKSRTGTYSEIPHSSQ